MTLGELIRSAEKRFRAAKLHYGHGTDNARDEAAFLVLRALRLPFDVSLTRETTPPQVKKIESLIRKRIDKRIPTAYLLNEAWLDGHAFYVDRRVIIPRSHIAFLLQSLGKPKRALDLCTGSGCLAILAAHAFPRAVIDATDVSSAALAVARQNVNRYRLQKRVRLIRSDLFNSIADQRYDAIFTNPPYVTGTAMRKLPPEYRLEPGAALAGGADGLFLVKKILREASHHLLPGGALVCEIGDGRRTLERAYPKLPFRWPQESVFILRREELG